MPQLRKHDAPKLLKMVGGKEHAGPEDHAEENTARQSAANKQLTEDEINADPMSSSDELEAEIIRRSERRSPSPPLPSKASKRATDSKRTNKKSTSASNGSANTKRTKRQQAKTMSVPNRGLFREGQNNKRKINGTTGEEKENIGENSNDSRKKYEEEFGWGSQSTAPSKKQKLSGRTTYGSSGRSNIHASQATSGKKVTYKKSSQTDPTPFTAKQKQPKQDDSESEVSMLDDNDPDADMDELLKEAAKKGIKLKDKKSQPSPPPAKSRPDLFASLGLYKQPESSPPVANLNTPASSQDPNALYNLEHEVANLPSEEALNSICPLCHKPVDPSHSIRFWKYHTRTIKHQSLFCKQHRERTAKVKYKERGYPEISWEELPARIRKLRPRLEKVLRNEEGFESKYRTEHAAKLVSGQAAVYRPKQKKSKKKLTRIENVEDVENDMEALPGDSSSSTGYYGPRGRRLMMEVLTTDLGDVFREVAVSDPVVGKSGFAEYIEHVLVPELTVMLVMDDVDVSEKKAEEVIAQGTELGMVLHEDVDDVVAHHSDDEEEEMELLDLDDDEKYEELT